MLEKDPKFTEMADYMSAAWFRKDVKNQICSINISAHAARLTTLKFAKRKATLCCQMLTTATSAFVRSQMVIAHQDWHSKNSAAAFEQPTLQSLLY